MIISHVPRYVVRNLALASGPGAARTPAGWNRWRERHRLCVVSLSFVSRSRLGQVHGLMVQPFNTNPAGRHRRASVEGGNRDVDPLLWAAAQPYPAPPSRTGCAFVDELDSGSLKSGHDLRQTFNH